MKRPATTLRTRALAYLSSHTRTKVTLKDLSARLRIRSKEQYAELRGTLEELEREGRVTRDAGGKFGYARNKRPKPASLEGVLRMTRRGEGYVKVKGSTEEIHIPHRFMKTAFPGDVVEVALIARPSRGRRGGPEDALEGEIVRVLHRELTRVSGKLEVRQRFAFIIPDDNRIPRDIYVNIEEGLPVQGGEKVVVELFPWENEHLNPEGKIIEVLGPAGDPRVEVLSVARSFGLPSSFPAEVEREASVFSSSFSPDEIGHRLDLRKILCVTIDPEDAKDFDDALSLEIIADDVWRLGVHIADVSHYVRAGTSLDREALARGTSTYLVNEVIPMLPARLSTDLCSLRPDEDRLTYSVLLDVRPDGQVEAYRIAKSIIRSKRRFTYEEVQQILERGTGEHAHLLLSLNTLAKGLHRKRKRAGSIDFETAEAKFRFDADGLPSAIIKKVRLDAHRLVEECMLLANRTVAEHIGRPPAAHEPYPFIYRVHDLPDPGRMAELASFAKQCGYPIDASGGVTARELQKLLDNVKGTELENLISEVAIRTMAKAIYSDKNIGHYGLAFKHYTHFTSPIRRYPDLIVHRLLMEYEGALSPSIHRSGSGFTQHAEPMRSRPAGRVQPLSAARRTEIATQLPPIAEQSSERERVAVEAERASVRVMQMEYMKRHIGDEFEGVIGGVTDFGLFVEINDLLVEGLVRVRDLADDYYLYDEKQYALRGRSRGKSYRLGDHVRVQVAAVDAENHQLDFVLVGAGRKTF